MRRILALLLYCCLPLVTRGDGVILPTVAFPTTVTRPDQQALIYAPGCVAGLDSIRGKTESLVQPYGGIDHRSELGKRGFDCWLAGN